MENALNEQFCEMSEAELVQLEGGLEIFGYSIGGLVSGTIAGAAVSSVVSGAIAGSVGGPIGMVAGAVVCVGVTYAYDHI